MAADPPNEPPLATAPGAQPTRRHLEGSFWRLWSASSLSGLGDGVRAVGLPLLAANLTHDPRAVSAVTVAEFLPWLLFSLLSGALVDRMDRRQIMWTADLLRSALLAGLVVAVSVGAASIVLLCVVGFLLGTAQTMFDNASQAILPAVVDAPNLPRANGFLNGGQTVGAQFAGPPSGAFLFGVAAALPFAVDAVSFLLSAALILSVAGSFRTPRAADLPRTSLRSDIAEGVRYLARHRVLRTLCLLLGALNLASAGWMAVAVLWALQVLHVGTTGYGFLFLGAAGGGLLGAVVADRLDARIGRAATLRLAYGLSVAATGILTIVSNPWIAGTVLAVAGFMIPLWNIGTVSLRQEVVPQALLGRVNSAYRMVGWGAAPIGAALGGLVASTYGLRATFAAGAIILAVAGILSYRIVNSSAILEVRNRAHTEADTP